ncbi:uncharacterized protein UTRI_04996 [Ustilago trichophora]|uniref:Sfi1 spindle body domain-containing protein n=1 Tax=Ustilago trichophora TaxID=86804 RepID=A0A5C3EB27_9BASI|nr:uncharacterized protein UTRI_04996 [Ustilago trichophora]
MSLNFPNARGVIGSRSGRPSLSGGIRSSSVSNSGLDQLRRNLQDVNLRQATHRPYYPSPLSQSPLQASLSSTSHTAASVASSSQNTVSTSTTPPSTSSRFSINQAFKALTDDDIHFFDRLVSTLPSHASDFSRLKAAYTAHLPEELNRRQRRAGPSSIRGRVDWDAHLWSILLSLVKVRGSNWRERWDSVRLAFGLDPNSGDETDLSAATQSTAITGTDSSTQHGVESHSDSEWDESHRRYLQAATSSASPSSALTPLQHHAHHSVLPARSDLGLPRSSSPPPRRNAFDAAAPASDHHASEEEHHHHHHHHHHLDLESRSKRSHLEDPISAIQARLSRLLEHSSPNDGGDTDSPGDSYPIDANNERDGALTTHAARLPADARRRFDELVRSSQSERNRLRDSHLATQEEEEQQRWSQQLEVADLWRARRLLQMCLAWWITLTRQQLEEAQNAADASARVTVDKAWERWRVQAQQEREARRTGEKTDRVRCTLTAFRHWKRRARIALERKEERKKDSMRTAYYTVTSAVKTRTLRQAFHLWKERYMNQVADHVRRRHLQAGALALWQMRSSHSKQLRMREKVVKVKRDHSILTQAWDRWNDRFDQSKALSQFQHYHHRLLAAEALHTWRKKAMLSKLSQAFTDRRLKLAVIDGWKFALEQRHLHRKQETIAVRWRSRRLKHDIITKWRRLSQRISSMEEQAITMQNRKKKERLHSLFHSWQLQSRAALFQRVRAANTVEHAFHIWKHRHTTLITSLHQRESSIVQRHNQVTLLAYLKRWSELTSHIRNRESQVQARRNEALCNDVFIAWRNKQLEHCLLEQKSAAVSDFFTLRSTFHQWRTQLRAHRADVKEANHNRRLVQQVFEIWKARTSKQQRLSAILQHSLAKSDQALARSYLNQWVARIIEVRSRELEVKEQRERRLVKAAFCAWIEACLRHDDLLALMNSYIDVKEEDRKRRMFVHWNKVAREHKERKGKAEMLVASARKKLLTQSLTIWQDKMKERSLATQEYDMLMRRQQLSLHWALNIWQSQTLSLPAIRMRNTSLKRAAFRHWRQSLPGAQIFNQAARIARFRSLQRSWQTWKNAIKFRRQLRAAARFGAGSISVQRLRTLSAAAAANRPAGSSSPSVAHSSSPSVAHSSSPFRVAYASGWSSQSATPVRRPRTSLALLPPASADASEPYLDQKSPALHVGNNIRSGRQTQRGPSFSRRSTSVPRYLETSLAGEVVDNPHQSISDAVHLREVESPSKEAALRRTRTTIADVTPTSASVSEHSRFSLALQSSTSSVSAAHEPRSGAGLTSRIGRNETSGRGPPLASVAHGKIMHKQAQSDTESLSHSRTRRSAKYEQSSLTTSAANAALRLGLQQPVSNDGFESANSVQSAPADRRHATPRQSLAVAEDMILQLRARAKSRQREQV